MRQLELSGVVQQLERAARTCARLHHRDGAKGPVSDRRAEDITRRSRRECRGSSLKAGESRDNCGEHNRTLRTGTGAGELVQSQQGQDVQAEACWRELRATWAGIGRGSDCHGHQQVGVLIHRGVRPRVPCSS